MTHRAGKGWAGCSAVYSDIRRDSSTQPDERLRGEAKVLSKKWVLIEVVAEGDATSGIGSERKNSIHFTAASKIGSAMAIVSEVEHLRADPAPKAAALAAARLAADAAECRPRLSAKARVL